MALGFAEIPFLSLTAVVADQMVKAAQVRLLAGICRQAHAREVVTRILATLDAARAALREAERERDEVCERAELVSRRGPLAGRIFAAQRAYYGALGDLDDAVIEIFGGLDKCRIENWGVEQDSDYDNSIEISREGGHIVTEAESSARSPSAR